MIEPRCFIYGLIDPRSLLVRYVGKTTTGMSRPKQHRYPRGRRHSERWVRSLLRDGLDYTIAILEIGQRESIETLERWWIAFGRALGWPLTNHTDGGEGIVNPTPEARARLSSGASKRWQSKDERSKQSMRILARTHCKNGHLLDEKNTRTHYRNGALRRACRMCCFVNARSLRDRKDPNRKRRNRKRMYV